MIWVKAQVNNPVVWLFNNFMVIDKFITEATPFIIEISFNINFDLHGIYLKD